MLFFSGGTALRATSQALLRHTHNSIHLITPFDSGGSSATLRRAFNMPAVGDLRNRLAALIDPRLDGFTDIHRLFTHRLPQDVPAEILHAEINALSRGEHALIAPIAPPARDIIRRHLHFFSTVAADFDPRGASLGNLLLAAGYLEHGRHITPAVRTYSALALVRGTVRLTVNADLQLRVVLDNGEILIGQHLITGKEHPPLQRPIADISLVDTTHVPNRPAISNAVRALLHGADLLCYPMGSFYSSLIANLLPTGVGKAVYAAPCRKIFVPNTMPDPESLGLDLSDQARILLRHLRRDISDAIGTERLLNAVLLDPSVVYPGEKNNTRVLRNMGIPVLHAELIDRDSGYIDPHRLCRALLSLI